jgi:hypothetical protein
MSYGDNKHEGLCLRKFKAIYIYIYTYTLTYIYNFDIKHRGLLIIRYLELSLKGMVIR